MVSSFLHFPGRVRFLVLLVVTLFGAAVPPTIEARPCRVVVVRSADLHPYLDVVHGIRESCQCSVSEVALDDGEGAAEVMARTPDIIIAVGTSALRNLKDISDIPIIYAMAVPSVALRFQQKNISGVSMDFAPAIHLATMQKLFPGKKRIGLIYDPRYTGPFVKEALAAAQTAGFDLMTQQISDPSQFPAAISSMENKIDIFWMIPDKTVVTRGNIELLLRFSFQKSVPVFTFAQKYLDMGAVASLDVDPYDIGMQAGGLANRIRTGRTSIQEYARTPHLAINRKVAAKMGFVITNEMMKMVKGSD